MPTSLDGVPRPPEMLRGTYLAEDQAFETPEHLYRRFDPEDVDQYEPGKYRLLTTAWDYVRVHNISVVRGKYGQPDHARWDSATPPEGGGHFVPQLYRDWYVFRLLVGDLDVKLISPGDSPIEYEFIPRHVPFIDLYPHTEIQAYKGAQGTKKNEIKQSNRFGSEQVKIQYRALLADRAVMILRPDEIIPEPPPSQAGANAASAVSPTG